METEFESKLRLIIRKPQSGKTFICIKDIEATPTDLHIVMTMNTIKANKQFLGRVIEKLGSEHIIIYNSDRDYELDEDGFAIEDGCHHCHTSSDVINVIRNNHIKVIIMCSHKVRWESSIHEVVNHLEDSKKFGTREISFHSDETHAYVNRNRAKIEKLFTFSIMRQFRMYSATPFPIWNEDKGSIWNKIYIVNVEDMYSLVRDEKYFGVKDCEFISILVSNEEVDYSNIYVDEELITMANGNYKRRPEWQGPNYYFDLGDEIKYLHSLKSTLPLLKLDANTFSYNFIPSYKRKITQYEIKNIIHNVYPTANVIIMNGNETGITLFRKTFSMDSNTTILEPSYQIDELLHRVRNIDNKPTFIVGFQTCNMSVTLIDEELGNFDNMIFYHDHLTKDPECLYQMMRIVFSYINWGIFSAHKIKKTKIYGHPAIHKIIIDYEEAVEKIELLEEGEYLRDEIQGNVPIKENKKKEKRVNYLQQIPPEFIEYDKDAYAVNPKNESRKWKQLEEDYREFIGHDLSERSDPRTKRTKTGFILNGSMGGKYKGKHVSNTDLSSWVEGLSWYSNYAITKKYYKYIRVYVGYKDLEDPTKYTIHTRMVNLTKDEEVTRLLTSYEESDN